MPSASLLQRTCRVILWLLIFMAFSAYAQQPCPVISVDPESTLSAEGEIEALRGDSGLLESAKDALVREASEHGTLLKKSELTDEKLFEVIRRDLNVRTVVLRAINGDCKLRKRRLTPIQPEELPKALGSQGAPQTPTLPPTQDSHGAAEPQAGVSGSDSSKAPTSSMTSNAEPSSASQRSSSAPQAQADVQSISRNKQKHFFKVSVRDQNHIWTSHFRLKLKDAFWLMRKDGI